MTLPTVLFLCGHNSCRSQIAEAWLRHMAPNRYQAISAGIREKPIHPFTHSVMAEVGVSTQGQRAKRLQEATSGREVDIAISVCSAADQNCPVWFKPAQYLKWHFDDPAAATGSEQEVLQVFRRVRDEIKARIEAWLAE